MIANRGVPAGAVWIIMAASCFAGINSLAILARSGRAFTIFPREGMVG
jgi:hypothetical protein